MHGRRHIQCGISRAERGFGLMEAIIALTILAASGAALFSWLAQSLQTASRLQQTAQRFNLQLLALNAMSVVNPAIEPKGERRIGDMHTVWTSETVAPLRQSYPYGSGESVRWRVGLYRMQVRAEDAAQGIEVRFEMTQTGLEPATVVRPIGLELPP